MTTLTTVTDTESLDATAVQVTGVLVVHDDRPELLTGTFAALTALTRRPDRLVLVDATPDRSLRDLLDGPAAASLHAAYDDLPVITAASGAAFAEVIDEAVEALPDPGEEVVVGKRRRSRARRRPVRPRDRREWLWLLHQDDCPAPDSLEMLMAVVSRSTRVGIAGGKVVAGDDSRRLLHVGVDITRTGRVVPLLGAEETDQGQHDTRRDVISVSTSGMLVRRDVYTSLGGFDPAFDGDGDALDLCWRAHLTGHQVVIVPQATVFTESGASEREDTRPVRIQRRFRQIALARCSWLGLPLLWLWSVLGGALLAAALLLGKRPRAAGHELATATAGFGLVRILGARFRFLRQRSVSRRSLRQLFVPAGAAIAAAWASMGQRTGDALSVTGGLNTQDSDEAQELPQDLSQRSFFAGPAPWAGLITIAAALAWWRHSLGAGVITGTGSGLTGGELLPFATDASGVWHTYVDAWQGAGLGHPNVPTPVLALLALPTWLVQALPWVTTSAAAAVTVSWLLIATVPLSGLTAYLAGRVATRSAWPRTAAALLWAFLPIATGALRDGRLGPAIAHILLPLALAAVLRIGSSRRRVVSTAGAILLLAALGAVSPVSMLALMVVALFIVLIGPGWARAHAVAAIIVPWLLLGRWSQQALTADWRMLLAGPGQLADPEQVAPWHLALLQPGGGLPWLGLPVVVLGILGLLRPGFARGHLALIVLGLGGLAGALFAPHLSLVDTPTGPRTPWAGTLLDLYAAALLGAALLGARGWSRADGRLVVPAVRRSLAVICGVGILAGLGVAGYQIWRTPQRTVVAASDPVPTFVRTAMEGPRAERALVLHGTSFELLGREVGGPARDLRTSLAGGGTTAAVVRSLLGGGTPGETLTQQLHDLGVGYVLVDGAGSSAIAALKVSGAVTQAGDGDRAWRVLPLEDGSRSVGVSRVVVASGDTPATPVDVVDVTGLHSRASDVVTADEGARTVVLAEGQGWSRHGRATLDGDRLSAVAGSTWPTYRLPASAAGQLSIDPGLADGRWLAAQGVLVLVVVYFAIPFGGRRRDRS